MKKTLLLILAFLPLSLLGQELKCCESTKDIESYLTGVWKVKRSNSKTLYKYRVNRGQGHWTEMEQTEKKGEYVITHEHPIVDIITYNQGFKLKIKYLYGHWTGDLKHLNARRMLVVSNGKETEFIKTSK